MQKTKAFFYLALTLLTTYILSEALVYGSSYCADMVNSLAGGISVSIKDLGILAAASAAGFLSAFLKGYCSGKFSLGIISSIKTAMTESLLNIKISILENRHTGEIMNKYTSDINTLEQYLTESFPKILTSCITILVVGKSFYQLNAVLVLEVGACCLLILTISFYTAKKLSFLAAGRKTRTDALLTIADDFLRGIMTGRSYNLFPIMKRKIDAAADEVLQNEYQRTRISSYSWLLQTISEWMPAFCLIGVLFLQAGELLNTGSITYLILMMNRMFKPFSELPVLLNETAEAQVSLQRIRELLCAEPEEHETQKMQETSAYQKTAENLNAPESLSAPKWSETPESRSTFSHEILSDAAAEKNIPAPAVELENLTFCYGKHTILKNLNLRIIAGEETAIVGASGGGKSTIFKILCGFLSPDEGNYRLFGEDASCCSLSQLRKSFALVPQTPYLFPGTIYENVSCGNPQASIETVIHACRQANIHQDIEKMALGYQTVLGENGAGLSGGEKQRLSLARALLKDAPILLLDEPTAALDADTEQSIRQTLDSLKGQKTIIMIAHRLSTVAQANRILVIHEGQVVESGTESELISKKGYYYRLKMAGEGGTQ